MPRSPRRPQRRLALRSVTHDRTKPRRPVPVRDLVRHARRPAAFHCIPTFDAAHCLQSDLRHLGLIGIGCLFWRYTAALGVATLGLMAFVWLAQKRGEALRKRYEHVQQPPQIVHLTLTESGYSLKGDDFFAEVRWSNVFNAFEGNGFLIMRSWQGPRLRVPIDQLQRAGVYERVRAIVDERSPSQKRR